MITSIQQMNPVQLADLNQLAAICKKVDISLPNLYTHILTQPRTYPAGLLYYQNNELLGFLSCYFFYEEAVEISILIHPSIRRQGIAKNLMEAILPLVQYQGYSKVIFSSPSHKNDLLLKTKGFSYLHSEYCMERNDLSAIIVDQKTLSFRPASLVDMQSLCELDKACFPQKQDNLIHRFEHLLNNREYQIIVALQNNNIIGKAHFRWHERGATFSDIAILPALQGQGLGSALIAYCINFALSEGRPELTLDVETHNHTALNLYIRLGFSVQNACDYWATSVEQLIP